MIGVVHALRLTEQPGPGEPLAGLSLAHRAVLTLQKLGAGRVVVLTQPEDDEAFERLAADARTRVPLEHLRIERGDALGSALTPYLDEPFVLLRHDLVVDPDLARALVDALDEGRAAVAAARAGRKLALVAARPPLADATLAALLARADALEAGERYAVTVEQGEGRRRAERALFEACRKPVDGIVSRHLNRHVSLFVSRLLVNTPVTPNQMTVITFLVGVAAAWLASRGGYAPTLGAAALMQLNSILDGCDGELARVRHQGSHLGQWLDTIGDDLSNVLFWLGLGLGARTIAEHGSFLAISGFVAAGANLLAALVNYRELWRRGSGDLAALSPPESASAPRLVRAIGLVLKQDFFLFLLLLVALAGVLPYALPAVALGAIITLGAAIARALKGQ